MIIQNSKLFKYFIFDTGFMVSCVMQPIFINNTENICIQEFIGNDEKAMNNKRTFYQGDIIQAMLRKNIPYLDQNGAFD